MRLAARGQREINVGLGHMKLHVDGDKSYSSMEVNVGMGVAARLPAGRKEWALCRIEGSTAGRVLARLR